MAPELRPKDSRSGLDSRPCSAATLSLGVAVGEVTMSLSSLGLSFPKCNTRGKTQYFLKSGLFLVMLIEKQKVRLSEKVGRCGLKWRRYLSEPFEC